MSTTAPPGPVLGPCTAWIDGDDVAGCCDTSGVDPDRLEDLAVSASMAMFEISGRRFSGICGPRVVRPCAQPCRCFGTSRAAGLGAWYWTSTPFGGWTWLNECGDRLGCQPMSMWRLAGYPVRAIVEVKIDGETVDPTGYRLDGYRWLVRLDDPGPPVVKRFWPGCQNMSLNDDQPGTMSVSYTWGVDPPQAGRDAAVALACQLVAACRGDKCKLPAGTTKVVRQGMQIERGLLVNWLDPSKPTGLVQIDTFLRAYWRKRSTRRGAVFSPDLQPFARRVGS